MEKLEKNVFAHGMHLNSNVSRDDSRRLYRVQSGIIPNVFVTERLNTASFFSILKRVAEAKSTKLRDKSCSYYTYG